MAEVTNNESEQTELASNNWFTEYGMPYTTLILENEAEMYNENTELAGSDRHPLSQFIIDQETAVAKAYHNGEISEEEFGQFKELSQARLDELEEGVDKELEEMEDDMATWSEGVKTEVVDFVEDHGTELETLVATAKERDLESKDVPLALFADLTGIVVNGIDTGVETIQPHIHDVVDSVFGDTVETAHAMVDARAEMEGTSDSDIESAREQLGTLEPVVDAEVDQIHEDIDNSIERFETEIEDAKDFVDVAKEHADLNPGLTVEHVPYKVVDDYDLPEKIDESTGVVDA